MAERCQKLDSCGPTNGGDWWASEQAIQTIPAGNLVVVLCDVCPGLFTVDGIGIVTQEIEDRDEFRSILDADETDCQAAIKRWT